MNEESIETKIGGLLLYPEQGGDNIHGERLQEILHELVEKISILENKLEENNTCSYNLIEIKEVTGRTLGWRIEPIKDQNQ